MKKTFVMFVIIALLLIGILIAINSFKSAKVVETGEATKGVIANSLAPLTKEDFASYLEEQQFVKDLPKDVNINFRFYNFNSGERQWEESYIITKGKVENGLHENPEATIILHSKYLIDLGNDFCNTIKKAKANGDVAVDTSLSKLELLWKFKSVLKYRECVGI